MVWFLFLKSGKIKQYNHKNKKMKYNIFKIFRPSWKKIIATIIFSILSAGVFYWLMGVMVSCMFSWGCDTLSLKAFVANLLAIFLIMPVYYLSALFQTIFKLQFEFLDKGYTWMYILGFFEIAYLYILSCVVIFIWSKFKEYRLKKKEGKNRANKFFKFWLWAPLIAIFIFDVLSFPRRVSYVLAVFSGGYGYFSSFNIAFKILFFTVLEIWYLFFLLRHHKEIFWKRYIVFVLWLIVLLCLLMNIFMLIFSFYRNLY
jgi:hypothetical protein